MNIEVNDMFFDLLEVDTRFCVAKGGAGSGKSVAHTQHFVNMLATQSGQKLLVLRKFGVTLNDSVISLFKHILKEWGLWEKVEYNKSERRMLFTETQSEILFKGLDDPEKVKSIAGITKVWMEEATEFDEADLDQLNLRLRGGLNLQLFLTLNPIDEGHWIKKRFFDREDKDVTIFHSTYLDNGFLDDSYINELLKYKTYDYNYYRIYALGEWGKLDSGGEFYKNFRLQDHAKEFTYNSSLPLHLSFDENVNPYMTLTIWQGKGRKLWQIDEICLESPHNTLDHTLGEFKKRYSEHNTAVYIYGDATSKKADVKLQKGFNFFTLIQKELQGFAYHSRVPKSNESVYLRGLFINEIWGKGYEDIEIYINKDCPKTMEDFKYLKEASDGTKSKEKERHPRTKISYEKYGHTSDTADYIICEYFKRELAQFKRKGRKDANIHIPRQRQRQTF